MGRSWTREKRWDIAQVSHHDEHLANAQTPDFLAKQNLFRLAQGSDIPSFRSELQVLLVSVFGSTKRGSVLAVSGTCLVTHSFLVDWDANTASVSECRLPVDTIETTRAGTASFLESAVVVLTDVGERLLSLLRAGVDWIKSKSRRGAGYAPVDGEAGGIVWEDEDADDY